MKVLVLKTVRKDMGSYYDSDFIYPESGYIEAPDWNKRKQCGNGIHGYKWGMGDGDLLTLDGKFLVIEVEENDIVELNGKIKFKNGNGKIKFKNGNVVFCGNQTGATNYIYDRHKCPVYGLIRNVADGETLISGQGSNICGRYSSKICVGYDSQASVKEDSILCGGFDCNLYATDFCDIYSSPGCTITCKNNNYIYSRGKTIINAQFGNRIITGEHSRIYCKSCCWVKTGYRSAIMSPTYSIIDGGTETIIVNLDNGKSYFIDNKKYHSNTNYILYEDRLEKIKLSEIFNTGDYVTKRYYKPSKHVAKFIKSIKDGGTYG